MNKFNLIGLHEFSFQTGCPVHFFGQKEQWNNKEVTMVKDLKVINCTCRKKVMTFEEMQNIITFTDDWAISHHKNRCKFCNKKS